MAEQAYALDSRAVLGLLAKANQIFTSPETTLSFPLGTPLAFNAAQLAAAMGPAPDAPGHALLAEFSTALNLIPAGVVWPPANQTGLDDIVREIVSQAEWAFAERTPEEETRYLAAQTQVDLHNPEMAAYASLKDAWIRAREALANTPDSLLTVEAEHAAHVALLAYPARERIEQAIQDLIALDERAPYRALERLERDISMGNGTFDNPSVGAFSPARLLPRAVLTSAGWDAVTLDRAALDELAASAPAILTDHLKLDEADDPIVQISFEYASAAVQRTWFDPGLFQLRCWRFPDPARLLSDGNTPPAGECPAYVRAVVLVRNVAVTVKVKPTPDGSTPSHGINAIEFLLPVPEDLLIFTIPKPIDPVDPPDWSSPIDDTATVMINPHLNDLVVRAQPWTEIATMVERPAFELAPERLDASLIAPLRLTRQPAEFLAADTRFDAVTAANTRLVNPDFSRVFVETQEPAFTLSNAVIAEAIQAPDFVLTQEFINVHRPSTPPPPPDTETRTTPAGTVIVLALICKSVPRSPNPNPDADWI